MPETLPPGTSSRTRHAAAPLADALAAESRLRERQIGALHDLWLAIPFTEPSRLYRMLTERVIAALEGHTCSLLLRERGTDVLRLVASVGLPTDVDDSVTLLVGERIAGRVAASRQPILVQKDPNAHPALKKSGDGTIESRPEVESAMCAPLLDLAGEAIGVLCVSRHVPARPYSDGDLRMFSLFAAQIGSVLAQHQNVEDLTRAAQEQARNAHLASLGQLAAMVAHELRNPLSSIKGAAQYLIQEKNASEATLRDFLNIVIEEADALGGLTTELLEFARPTPPMRIECDLARLLRDEAAFLKEELARLGAVTIRVETPATPALCLADPTQLGGAIRNLFLNAAQAIASVGNSRVDGRIHARLVADADGYWQLTVEDNGPGLSAAVQDRLFEPFFTTRAKGTGLGLAQVRRTIELHNGDVTAENTGDGGACFCIHLPKL
jgi:signal transduction histidine kinase